MLLSSLLSFVKRKNDTHMKETHNKKTGLMAMDPASRLQTIRALEIQAYRLYLDEGACAAQCGAVQCRQRRHTHIRRLVCDMDLIGACLVNPL